MDCRVISESTRVWRHAKVCAIRASKAGSAMRNFGRAVTLTPHDFNVGICSSSDSPLRGLPDASNRAPPPQRSRRTKGPRSAISFRSITSRCKPSRVASGEASQIRLSERSIRRRERKSESADTSHMPRPLASNLYRLGACGKAAFSPRVTSVRLTIRVSRWLDEIGVRSLTRVPVRSRYRSALIPASGETSTMGFPANPSSVNPFNVESPAGSTTRLCSR